MSRHTLNIFTVLIMFYGCVSEPKFEATETVIQAINELQSCEEENIFYKITYGDLLSSNKRDSLVLFSFSEDLDSLSPYTLFFPAIHHQRVKVEVRGYFSEKAIYDFSYGCPGSKQFKVTEIISLTDVTKSMDFPIDYKDTPCNSQ